MKKAYLKPVFLAEVFEGTASVATCTQDYDPTKNLMQVYNGLRVCEHQNEGHEIGKGQGDVKKNFGVMQRMNLINLARMRR